jgi:Flp pilus assembly protein TadG
MDADGMKLQLFLNRLRGDERGATAVEYGFVLPILIIMILGGIWASLLTFSVSSLDMAAQSAARCMAVDANTCGTPTDTATYAQSRYAGPNISPVFTASATGCGHTVTAQATFNLNIIPGITNLPLSVSACYP